MTDNREQAADVPMVQATAPERIWLAVADDIYAADQPFPGLMEEVTWSDDAPIEVCVPYIRADFVDEVLRAARKVIDRDPLEMGFGADVDALEACVLRIAPREDAQP